MDKKLNLYFFIAYLYSFDVLGAPGPGTIVQVFQLGSVLLGILAALGGSLTFILLKFKKKNILDDKKLIGIFLSVLLFFSILSFYLIFKVSEYKSQIRSDLVASEYRCDLGYHHIRNNAIEPQNRFNKMAPAALSFKNFKNNILKSKNPYLIDLRLNFWYEKGFLKLDNQTRFMNILPSELIGFLEGVLKKDHHDKDLFLISRRNYFFMYFSQSEQIRLTELIKGFKSASSFNIRNLSPITWGEHLFSYNKTGKVENAVVSRNYNPWPLTKESLLLDSKTPLFKNFSTILSPKEISYLIKKPNVKFILPFSHFYRNGETYKKMVLPWFFEFRDKDDLIFLDYSNNNIKVQIDNAIKKIGDSPFACIGIGKFDCTHYGLDFVYQMNKQNDNALFLGYSNQLPRAASYLASEKNQLISKLNEIIAIKSLQSVKRLKVLFKLSNENSLFFLGLLIALITLPFSIFNFLELKKIDFVKNHIKKKNVSFSNFPYARYRDILIGTVQNPLTLRIILLLGSILPILMISLITAQYQFSSSFPLSFLNPINTQQSLMILALSCLLVFFWKKGNISKLSLKKVIIATLLLGISFIVLKEVEINLLVFYMLQGFIASNLLLLFIQTPYKNLPYKRLNKDKLPIIPLDGRHDLKNVVGEKGRRLNLLKNINMPFFKIADGIIIQNDFLKLREEEKEDKLKAQTFIKDNEKFIVRSNNFHEDGKDKSYAGKYLSLLNISSGQLSDAITKVSNSYENSSASNSVLVQEMCYFDFSGVLFTTSVMNGHLSTIEYLDGNPEDLVNDNRKAFRMNMGRVSGALLDEIPTSCSTHKSELESLFKKLFLIGKEFAQIFGAEQDIEWGYNLDNNEITILQSREITSFQHNIETEKEKEVLFSKLHSFFPENLNDVTLKLPCECFGENLLPLNREIISWIYAHDGPIARALDDFNFKYQDKKDFMISVGSSFYEMESPPLLKDHLRDYKNSKRKTQLKKEILLDPEKYISILEEHLKLGQQYVEKISSEFKKHSLSEVKSRALYFLNNYYTGSFKAQFMAESIIKDNDARGVESLNELFISKRLDRQSEYYRDLLKLKENKDLEKFITKWGHRSPRPYDMSVPSFAENPLSAQKYADSLTLNFDLLNPQNTNLLSYYREAYKDLLLKYLSYLRPYLLTFGEDVFSLRWEEIEKGKAISQERKDFIDRSIRFSPPEKLNLMDIEQWINFENNLTKKNLLVGNYVSTSMFLKGKICHWDPSNKLDPKQENIIVSKRMNQRMIQHFNSIKGIIVENVNSLSHISILARELCIPVLELKNACDLFDENQNIQIEKDGTVII